MSDVPSSMNEEAVLEDKRRKNWFWDYDYIFDADMSEHAKMVRLYLARCANQYRQAWPSLTTIAKHCSISRPTVIKAIHELVEKGWIKKEVRQSPNGEFYSTVYTIHEKPQPPKDNNEAGQDETPSKSQTLPVNETTGGKSQRLPVNEEDKAEGSKSQTPPVNDAAGRQSQRPRRKSQQLRGSLTSLTRSTTGELRSTLQEGEEKGNTPYGDATRSPGTQREETGPSKVYGSPERIQEVSPCSKDISEGIERSSSVSSTMQGTERKGSTVGSNDKDTVTPKRDLPKKKGGGNGDERPHNSQKVVGSTTPAEDGPPTNQQLIAELVRKFRELPGVKPERGHYPMVGKCYNKYGYEAVQGAIEDLMYEFMWRQDQGMPIPEGKQLWAYFVKKCQWNYRPPLTEEEREARKKPLFNTAMYKQLPDGRVEPKTLEEMLPPGFWIEGNTIHIPKQKPQRKGETHSVATG